MDSHSDRVPVNICAAGDFVKLYLEEANKYAAVVESRTLSELCGNDNITLYGIMQLPKKKPVIRGEYTSMEVNVEILIYGFQLDADDIGELLSNGNHFLQNPYEWDTRVPYLNPQYLIRPGGDQPTLDPARNAIVTLKSEKESEVLDKTQAVEFLQVFNAASGPTMFCEVFQSPLLKTDLKE
jgi:hypothetical protein